MNEERLILAVIERAVRDYRGGGRWKKDAVKYFGGPTYRHHITALGLPPDVMPIALLNGRKRGRGARPVAAGGQRVAAQKEAL
jgi:hypothetical protein